MLRCLVRRVRQCAGPAARRCVALLALSVLTLALAGPLVGLGFGGDPTFCCRSGRCCCDSEDSPEGLVLEAACRCARADGTALALTIPHGLLAPGPTLVDAAPAELHVSRPVPVPQDGESSPPDQPPRFSRIP